MSGYCHWVYSCNLVRSYCIGVEVSRVKLSKVMKSNFSNVDQYTIDVKDMHALLEIDIDKVKTLKLFAKNHC